MVCSNPLPHGGQETVTRIDFKIQIAYVLAHLLSMFSTQINARKQSSKWQNFKMDVGENWNITKS